MRKQAMSLENRIHRLQSDIYNYQSKLEEEAEKAKKPALKKKYLYAAELAGQSAFELDVSHSKMHAIHAYTL